jgi:citrate synthase
MSATKHSAGLRGQSAGDTAFATVGQEGAGLTYRGYDIEELAEQAARLAPCRRFQAVGRVAEAPLQHLVRVVEAPAK